MSRGLTIALALGLATAVLAGTEHAAQAYPQFQLVRDQTCSGCHLSPAGGGLLSENGYASAEAGSQWGTAPEFLYDKLPLPSWLALGGDLRAAAGIDARGPARDTVMFPMQAELYAAASHAQFSLHVTAGLRDPQYRNTVPTLFASREHWLQWQQHPGEPTGLVVRVGRFMPVFGLRYAEHPTYTRRYGGTPLYGETYAAAVEAIEPGWEVHATAFIRDPVLPDSIERGNGATLYAEARLAEHTSVGVEGKLDVTPDDRRVHGGVTAKQLVLPQLVLAAEVQLVHQHVDAGGGSQDQLVGSLLGSYFAGAFMIDLGVNVFHENLAVKLQDQEAVDLNVHWFVTSHLEALLTSRFQMLAFGADGYSSGYSLLQLHYRL